MDKPPRGVMGDMAAIIDALASSAVQAVSDMLGDGSLTAAQAADLCQRLIHGLDLQMEQPEGVRALVAAKGPVVQLWTKANQMAQPTSDPLR